ncbi:phage tail spike protein [Microaceticoccus formicicus]|uniref:phage tail spike protein n=1 Tax=Microaceticoccus formicicus TaxID=3118105 RepID=UPI003CD00E75|nr:phage tail spike protein [Peptoniphilaceae bacterium AMB_02]
MILKIFNRDEEYIKNIEVFNYEYKWQMNAEHSLKFDTFDEGLEEFYRILYKDRVGTWREFIITEPVQEHTEDGNIIYSVYAEDSFYETIGDFLEDKRPQNTSASVALMQALEPSRWEVGIVENLGTASTNYYRESVKSAVQQKLIPKWKAEFDTRIKIFGNKVTNRYVDLYKEMGTFHGKRFVYDKDMIQIKRTVDMSNFCTALYGYGKGEQLESGGFGRRIDFADVNNEKAYLENEQARLKYGRNSSTGKKHIFDKIEFDDCEDKIELKELTQKVLDERSVPRVTYECKVIDLGEDFENVDRGDTVIVKDNDLGIAIKARIIEYTEIENEETHIVLGNYKNLITDEINRNKDFISNFRDKSGIWDRAEIIQEGGIDASFLKNLVEQLNLEMNERGGYVYVSNDGKGLTTYDRPINQNPTMAIQILGGSFRIANSKYANGEWRWKTFGDGDGFVADFITTGTLTANLIKAGILSGGNGKVSINMETGALNIDNDIVYDPTTRKVQIKGWTEIDAATIKSGTINSARIPDLSADKITSGTINANTINVENLNASNLTRGTVGTSISNTSGHMASGYRSASIAGSATGVNANSSVIRFDYANNRLEVDGRIDAYPEGRHHTFELNGMSLRTPYGYCEIKPWSGNVIQCNGGAYWKFSEIRVDRLYVNDKQITE